MNCPSCKAGSQVTDSRKTSAGVRRRRECLVCRSRFSTVETFVGDYTSADAAVEEVICDKVKASFKSSIHQLIDRAVASALRGEDGTR